MFHVGVSMTRDNKNKGGYSSTLRGGLKISHMKGRVGVRFEYVAMKKGGERY